MKDINEIVVMVNRLAADGVITCGKAREICGIHIMQQRELFDRIAPDMNNHAMFFSDMDHAETVVRAELDGWEIVWVNGSEGFCDREKKVITLGKASKRIVSLALHEVAHALVPQEGRDPHDHLWFYTFGQLMERHIPGGRMPESEQTIHEARLLKGDGNDDTTV